VLTIPVHNVKIAGRGHVRLDNLLGRRTYPIFINHLLVFFCCEKLFGLTLSMDRSTYVVAVIIGSLASALALSQVQTYVEHIISGGEVSAPWCSLLGQEAILQ
jgi:hypothetical protein